MITQIENTEHGYIVGVFLRDGNGYGQWHRLRNFGVRQGDAIEFRDDLRTFSYNQIKGFIRTFDIGKMFRRIARGRYELQR